MLTMKQLRDWCVSMSSYRDVCFFCDLVLGLLSTGLGQIAVFSLPPTPRTYSSVLPLEHWDPNLAALHPSFDFLEMFTLSFIYVHIV